MIPQKRKTATCEAAEKVRLSKTEDKLIVRIPPVGGLGIVVVQPQAVVIAFEVEDVRVAVPVSWCARYRLYHCPRNLPHRQKATVGVLPTPVKDYSFNQKAASYA